MKTERSLSSFCTQSVFVLLCSHSFINTHICITQRSGRIILSEDYENIFWFHGTIPFVQWCSSSSLVSAFTHVFLLVGFHLISLLGFCVSWALLLVLFLFYLFRDLRALMIFWPVFVSLRMLLWWLKELSITSGPDLDYFCGLRPGPDCQCVMFTTQSIMSPS